LTEEKLESLRRCLWRLSQKRPDSLEKLLEDYDLQDILSVNLERAVQICVDLAAHLIADMDEQAPATMAESFELLRQRGVLSPTTAERMKKAVGFRNIAVHTYQKIDWQIVFNIVRNHLTDFEDFAREIARPEISDANGLGG